MNLQSITKYFPEKDDPGWQKFQLTIYSMYEIVCIAGLALISFVVFRGCSRVIEEGYTCGIGITWFILAAGFFMIGLVSAWKLYELSSCPAARP